MTSVALPIAQMRHLLVDPGLVQPADFDAAAREAEKNSRPLDDILVEHNAIPAEYLGQLIADAIGVPFVRLSDRQYQDHVLRMVPENFARRAVVVAFGQDDQGRLMLAMRDPDDLETVRFIEKRTMMRVAPFLATRADIEQSLTRYARDLESAIRSVLAEAGGQIVVKEEGDESPVIRVVDLLMNYGYQNNASDIHIEPRENEVVVRYRIDGILYDVVTLPIEFLDPIVTRIKILARLRTDEHFAAQDGKFQEVISGERIDVRVSIMPIVSGEKTVMRLLAERGRRFHLEDIGLMDADVKKVRRHIRKSFGMILVTGPTGSGKTTTLYAILKILNVRDVNIATIEDPIEYAIDGVNQIQVNPKTGLTFASGLRSIVRQDPNIIMVGEIRDNETAGIAVNAAMTGHLVLSTLHTNDAATTLPRFRDMGIEPFLITSTINVIVSQRLVRKICSRCITSYDLKRGEVEGRLPPHLFALIFPKKTDLSVRLYKGKGCDRCNHTGYQGRYGIFEVLEMDDKIRDLIMNNANAKTIRQTAVDAGMTTMLEDGIRKVLNGVTTVDEVLRVAGE